MCDRQLNQKLSRYLSLIGILQCLTLKRQRALNNPAAFIKLAAKQGHRFTVEALETQLNQLSDEEVAAIFNPGIPPRHHLFPGEAVC